MLPYALDVAQDATSFLATFWSALVIAFFMSVALLYIFAYVNRFFEYLKAQESKYLDRRTLDLLRRVMLSTWTGLFVIIILLSFAVHSVPLHDALLLAVNHMPSILFVVFVLTGAVVSARIVGRFLSYLRGQLEMKPERVLPARSLVLTEMVVKYSIYVLGIVVAVLGGLGLLPPGETPVRQFIQEAIFIPLAPLLSHRFLTPLFMTLILMAIAVRLAGSVFTDFKQRTRKFTPRVIDLFHAIARYTIYSAAALTIVFLTLSLSLSADQLILIGLVLVLVSLTAVLVLYDPISNALSGIALINTDPFREGDRIKVGDDLVCDVLEVNLTNTRVRTLRGEIVNIPNREFLSKSVMNFTRSRPYAMTVDVTVSFDIPHWRVEKLLLEAARRIDGILTEPGPEVYASKIEGNTVSYQLWAYIRDPADMKRLKSELIAKTQDLFHEENIKVLFLQV